ncbi:MAG: hypothetical protein Q8S32_12355 [Burkholderiaceae bacterium]|nr:hypothetical protein [Burkholderiaceae bacterium]
MHSYPLNSPQSAARVLAVVVLADGHCSQTELALIRAQQATTQLGLTADAWECVVRDFVDDLMLASRSEWTGAGRMDAHTREQLLSEVTDPGLQERLRALARSVVLVDGHVTDDELLVLSTMDRLWQRPVAISQVSAPSAARPLAA